jgi:succinate-semialdehyde dehydrogenase/glutarate-semialdehyde dehydrogenase
MESSKTILIGGIWLSGSRTIKILNPATGAVVGELDYGGRKEAEAALIAASEAFIGWAQSPPRVRAEVLRRTAELLVERRDAIGRVLAEETGKRLPEAIAEVQFASEYFRWFGEEVRRPSGKVIPHEIDERRHMTISRPSGVAAILTPWNFPVSIQARKLAAALGAGCTVVARTSESAPLAVVEMFRLLQEAGCPGGVANLVHGPAAEITETWLASSVVKVVSFTGSTKIGRDIMRLAANNMVRPCLELGGDAPFIVFEDAHLDNAVAGAMIAKFRNNGQSCLAANRFLIHGSIYDRFVGRLVEAVNAMTIGDGCASPVPDLGPLINEGRVSAVRSLVDEALANGAQKLTRDFELPRVGSYMEPALIGDLRPDVSLACTEVFGPVAGVFRFATDEEALEKANDTDFGLAAYIYTRDLSRTWHFGERLQAGIIGINNPLPPVAYAPMGGVGQSGIGREGGAKGLEEFEDTHYLALGM